MVIFEDRHRGIKGEEAAGADAGGFAAGMEAISPCHHTPTRDRTDITIVTPPDDELHRIIFETDGKKVVHIRAGQRPAVDYIEGCA